MRIELVNLEVGKSDFTHVYRPEELDLADERVHLVEAASVFGNVRLAGTQIFVSGHIDTRAQVECDRCLKQIQLPVNADFSVDYITGRDYEASRAAELTEDEMSVSVFDGEVIDIDEIVKEQILLIVPTRTLCGAECKGFCPTCGTNKNLGDCRCDVREVDPRWAALKNLTNGK
jgi:DUF177 domain-containing protein